MSSFQVREKAHNSRLVFVQGMVSLSPLRCDGSGSTTKPTRLECLLAATVVDGEHGRNRKRSCPSYDVKREVYMAQGVTV